MNNFDLKNYDFGSNNALMLEQRLRNAGVWPDNPMLATKLLRRQLRILEAILQVASIGLSTIRALQKNGNHLSLSDNKLNVVSGRKRRFHRYLFLTHRFEKTLPEAIVTEGEDVDLAVKLYDQVKAAGLSLCVC